MLWLIAALALLLAIKAMDFFEGEDVLRDVRDEIRLAGMDLAELDRRSGNALRSSAIVCLTTIPSRLPYIDDTLKSLLRQTLLPREIWLHIPAFSKREDRPYEVPGHLRRLQSVRVRECDDWGPATKFIPALSGLPPDQLVIVLDDDRIYPPNLVRDLDAAAQAHPDAAFGLSGWIVPDDLVDRPTTIIANVLQRPPAPVRATRLRAQRRVDVLQGVSGYIVRPRFFDLARLTDYTGAPAAAFTVDDVWMSAHCRVPKYVVPARRSGFQPWRRRVLYKRTSLGRVNRGRTDEERGNSIMLRHFSDAWMTSAGKAMNRAPADPAAPRGGATP
jgi:hypothetical protein